MVQAIGATAGYQPSGSGASASGLQAQLARYQKQLSECVNCASAKTPEGKATIESLSAKISDIRERIDQVAQSQPGNQAKRLPSATSEDSGATSDAQPVSVNSDGRSGAGGLSSPSPASAVRTVGVLVDVLA